MRITRVTSLDRFIAKIEIKHHISFDEIKEVLLNQPLFEFAAEGNIEGEDLYRAIGQTDAGRYLVVFFIDKHRGVALVISARDANKRERKHYGRHQN
ncbi:MAG: hypothetical protein DMF75_14155 [Acidobacteria bacterium]|nr:MAG: hypothetical protein DMF75_14155 [Acidobacteriota bacterium]